MLAFDEEKKNRTVFRHQVLLQNPRDVLAACGSQSPFFSTRFTHQKNHPRRDPMFLSARSHRSCHRRNIYALASLVTLSEPHSFSFGSAALLRPGRVPARVAAASMERILREWTTAVTRRRMHPGQIRNTALTMKTRKNQKRKEYSWKMFPQFSVRETKGRFNLERKILENISSSTNKHIKTFYSLIN